MRIHRLSWAIAALCASGEVVATAAGSIDLSTARLALAANLPCILAQRYNRARFQRLLARLKASP